jgi:D-alanine transaminase
MIAYHDGDFLPKSDVCISPDDRGFLFGDGVYEVACAYDGQLFRMDDHTRRLERSLRAIRITPPDLDARALFEELLRRNNLGERHGKVYVQVTRGAAPRQHPFPDEPVPPTVYAFAEPYEPPREKWRCGVSVVTRRDERWTRCDVKDTALLPNVLASQQAQEAGAFETILVRDGDVTEGSHSTVFAAMNGTVVTHPLTERILPGVTREVVLELCEQEDLPVREAPLAAECLPQADEVIVVGTTTGVMPVVQVDDAPVGDGEPGPVTRTLQRAFRQETGL